jgi:hypothetical protein
MIPLGLYNDNRIMENKMDRTDTAFASSAELEEQDRDFWKKATVRERLETITWLRECFYGPEATTGRLQRFYTFTQQK